jgi:hypothetical protein
MFWIRGSESLSNSYPWHDLNLHCEDPVQNMLELALRLL